MSNGIVVRASSLGKMYRVFSSRVDNLVDALGLAWAVPGVKQRYREFWALRGVDLELRAGSRIGIVGRNGAGKSTLLKLITGNLAPTEGAVEVHEVIHALIEAGAGFHPEFTGFENIRVALTYQGLTPSETEAAIAEIAEFTELGEFLDQPYRTYSSGMQARLAFATATAILSPKILIIDEILGAGDAYFVSKCNERMRALVSSGATVILVSHSLDHVTSICEEAIWIDRGRIVKRGAALEVVKAYQQFLRVLDDRRLKAKNRKVHSAHYHPLQYDNFSDTLVVQAMVKGPANATCEVAELCLLRGGEVEDRLLVGHAQDADPTQASFILADSSHWGPPMWVGRVLCRQITVPPTGNPGLGVAAFNLYSIYEDTDYALEVTYRSEVPVEFAAEVYRNGVLHGRFELPVRTGHWARGRLEIPRFVHGSPGPARTAEQLPAELTTVQEAAPAGPAKRRKSRWPGEGRLAIEEVLLLDEEGRERAVFPAGSTMRLNVRFKAREAGTFDVIPVAVLYRLDGVLVCRYVGAKVCLPMDAEESREATLTVAPLKLGNGYYVFTVALYRVLDLRNLEEAKFYDLLDRSYEFGVEGTPPMLDGIFNEPGQWAFDGRRPLALSSSGGTGKGFATS